MRLAALLMTSLFTTVVGCAASSADDAGTSSADVTAACTAAYEDDAIVVYADHTYAAKLLHVTDMRITPANPNGTSDWEGSRFYESHVEYDLTPRVDDATLARARAAVGADLTPATIAIDASSASTQTLVTPGSSSFMTTNGVLVAELTDHFAGPSSMDSGPIIGASLRKSLLLGARAKAKAGACDLALTSAAPVTFDIGEAKVLVPSFEMSTIEGFLAFSNTYRAGHLQAPLARIASPAVDAATRDFSDVIERDVRPLTTSLATLSHEELVTKLEAAWQAMRAYAHVVLAETHASVDEGDFVTKGADGLWSLASMNGDAYELLSVADAVKTDLEGSIRDTNGGWTTRPLEP
jgi:hypothetical protein